MFMVREFRIRKERGCRRPTGIALAVLLLCGLMPFSTAAGEGLRIVDGKRFASLDARIRLTLPAVRSVLVLQDGGLVHETYFDPDARTRPQRVHSVTKSVLALLVGIARAEGRFPALDTPIARLFPHTVPEDLHADYERLQVRHLLSMTSGQFWTERGETLWLWATSLDRRAIMLSLPLTREPGTRFHYNTGASDLLGHILSDAVGERLSAYAQARLFHPLGIGQARWLHRGSAHDNAGAGLMLTPRDLARLGLLVLDRGVWQGRQVVPAAWIDDMLRNHDPGAGHTGYGYQWWIGNRAGCRTVSARGRGGQLIAVVPEKRLVIVLTSTPSISSGGFVGLFRLVDGIVGQSEGTCRAEARHVPVGAGEDTDVMAGIERLPMDLRPLFRGFVAAFDRGDLEAVMGFYSDRFRAGRADKAQRRRLWRGYLAGGHSLGYSFDAVRRLEEDLYLVHGHVHGAFGRFAASFHVVREEGQWRFLGERDAGRPPPALPADLRTFLDAYLTAREDGDLAAVLRHFSRDYRNNGYGFEDLERLMAETLAVSRVQDLSVSHVESESDGYSLRGRLRFAGLGPVPLELLHGRIRREADGLRWIGNGVERPAVKRP